MMEKKDLYIILILIESMFLPFLIPIIGFVIPSLVLLKGLLAVILLWVIYLISRLICSLSFNKKMDLGWLAYSILALFWNMFLIIHFVFFGFDNCPGCGY
jgi:hypothetical protein